MVSGSPRQAPRGFCCYVLRFLLDLAEVYCCKVRDTSRTQLPCHGSKDDGLTSTGGSISGSGCQLRKPVGQRQWLPTSEASWSRLGNTSGPNTQQAGRLTDPRRVVR